MTSIICALLAVTTVYRLELTDNVPFIVGEDGVRRQVVIVDPEEYAILKGDVKKLLYAANKTEESRVRLHGKRKEQIIEGTEKSTIYEDGYVHVEKMVQKSGPIRATVSTNRNESAFSTKPSSISARHWEMRKRRAKMKDAPPKQVTVEHNALTGKDEVK